MAYDITSIKERLDLIEIMRADGHAPKRVGSRHFVSCPFHVEKSGSCTVEERKFHCFGCGAGGDVFDYWERSRGLSKKEALDELAAKAGITPEIPGYTRPLSRPTPRPAAEEIVPPLTAAEREDWLACVDALRSRPREIARIAEWRGIDREVVSWAVESGFLGLRKWSGVHREAFLVEMPESPTGALVPVSTHIRLAPRSRGNDHPKASWRFDPPSRGSWPLIFGDRATASYIFLVEGQWDAFALIHLMRWHITWPPSVCLLAMRGATSFRKLLSHYRINEKSTVFAIADADNAGAEWFQDGGLVSQLSGKVARVFSFWPGRAGADLNDLVKDGSLDRDTFVSIIRPKLRQERFAKPTGPTFYTWCKSRTKGADGIARASCFVVADPARPSPRAPLRQWQRHWQKLRLPDDLVSDLIAAWETYKEQCNQPSPTAAR
jgi:hypothetical protein